MKQTYTIILVLLSLIVFGQTPKKINHVLIIDKSGSMVGKGDGNGVVIWNDVKAALKSYINDVNTGDKITIYQFHAFLLDPVEIEIIEKNRDINRAKALIDKINPDGVHTYLKKAVKTVLENYDFLNSNGTYDINLGIYTDGIDNSSEIPFEEICKLYRIKKGESDFAYYISIGKNVPKEVSDQNDIVVAPSVNPKDIIATQERLKREDSIKKAIEKRTRDSIGKIKQDSIAKEIAKADSIEAIIAKNKRNCIDQGGTWDCDENNNCDCDVPLSIIDYVVVGLGFIVLLLLIWILLLKKRIFPTMTGRLLFDQDVEINLKGSYKFVLYTADQVPSYAKSGFLGNLFCGKIGKLKIPATPENLSHINNFIEIKPINKRNKYFNNMKTFGDLDIDSEYKILYHDLKYKIKDKNAETNFIFFIYNNEKHTISY